MPFVGGTRNRVRQAACAALALGVACAKPHDPSRDHTLVIALAGEPALLLPPLIAETPGFIVADQILERLAEPDTSLDVIGDRAFQPRLADGWAWSRDSMSIAFRIAPNAMWHDGRPVTARDVRFTFALYTDTAIASPAAPLLANIDSVQVRGEHIAVFWFRRRHARQFFDATYHMRILPEHVLGALKPSALRNSGYARAPTGSGPFRFARWIPGQLIELDANARFHRGRPRMDRLVFTIAPDPSAALARAMAGDVDVVPEVRAGDIATAAQSRRIAVARWASLSSGLILFNVRAPSHPDQPHAVLAGRSVRQAMARAIDRRRVTAAALGGAGQPAAGPLPAMLLDDTSALLAPLDTAAAAALLDATGWRRAQPGGVRRRGSTPLRFSLLVPVTGAAARRAAVVVQDQLQRLGIAMDIEPADNAAIGARLAGHDFDAALVALDWDPNPLSARQLWGSPKNGSEQSSNFGGYRSSAFDSAMAASEWAPDSVRASAAMSNAWRALVNDPPAIWLYDFRRVAAIRRCLRITGVRADAWWAGVSGWSVVNNCRDEPDH